MIYVAPKYAHNKFSNVWGCMKVDLTEPLKKFVEIGVVNIDTFKIDVDYQTLSNAYFYCW